MLQEDTEYVQDNFHCFVMWSEDSERESTWPGKRRDELDSER